MTKEANELAGGRETPTKTETEDSRKKLRNKEYKSKIKKIEYAELKKTVKRKKEDKRTP